MLEGDTTGVSCVVPLLPNVVQSAVLPGVRIRSNGRLPAALGDANRLFRGPPFPPPAQRCAFTCVLSNATCSGGPGETATVSKICCQIPRPLQRLKRLYTVVYGPYSGWRILPTTSRLQHMDDPAQNPSIILRLRTGAVHRNQRLDLRPLHIIQPEQIRSHRLAPRIS